MTSPRTPIRALPAPIQGDLLGAPDDWTVRAR
jgi:hypothetical protein